MTPHKLAFSFAFIAIYFAPLVGAAGAPRESEPSAVRSDFVGDAGCISCHKDISQSYQHTGHHLTSQLPTSSSILGSFRSGSNVLIIVGPAQSAEPGLRFLMEPRKNGFFETAQSGWKPNVFERSERIDLVTGSGARGQTYLYWQEDRLFELPVSYWTDGHRWINSPGYMNGSADFSREVNPACLECHATYIRALSDDPNTNRYDKNSLIVGISCESCHGAGAKHVQLELKHEAEPIESASRGILNPENLSRDRKIDLCAECHNGIQREALAPTFSYVPGRPLREYFKLLPSPGVEHPDVHGNQVGLLERSKCYQSSEKMNCTICHDVHKREQAAETYSLKCLTCHRWQSCGMSIKLGHDTISNRCIDCHMPIEETNVIVSETAGQVVRAKMRNHWIKVYPGVSLVASIEKTEAHSGGTAQK